MKKTKLKNSHVSALISDLNHEDIIFISDIARQCPTNVPKIDLAVMNGIPSFEDVLEGITSEATFEEVIFAEETLKFDPKFQETLETYLDKGIKVTIVTHVELTSKYLPKARGLIRTGSTKAYRNIALKSAVCPYDI